MGFQSLANSITTYFQTVMDAYDYTARYDSDPRATPTSGLWCEVLIDFGDSQQKEIGINSYREVGNLVVRIKQEAGLGLSNLPVAADRVASAFRNTDIDNVISFHVPRIIKNGRIEDNYQVTVTCPFHYDEVSFVGKSFASLFDTPDSFDGAGGYFVKVKDDETGVEFEASDVGWLTKVPVINVDEIKKQLKPTQVQIGAFFGYSLPVYNNDNEEIYYKQMVPERWNGTTNIHFCLMFALSGSEDVGDKFKIQLSWNKNDHTNIISSSFNDLTTETTILTGRSAQYNSYLVEFEIPYSGISVNELFGVRVRRIAASSNEVSNEIIKLCCHMEFKTNKIFGTEAI